MKKRLLLLVALSFVLSFVFMSAPSAGAEVVFSTRPWFDDGGPCVGANETNMAGIGLQTPAGEPYVLNSVTIKIHEVVSSAEVVLYLYDDVGASPAWDNQIATIATLNVGATDTYGEYTFVPGSALVLNPSTVYWFVLTSTDADGCAVGLADKDGGTPGSGLFTLVAEYQLFSGSFNNQTGEVYMMEVDASPYTGAVSDDYDKIGQIRVVAPGIALYENAGGNVVRDANFQEIWIPNQSAPNPYEDVYDVIDQTTVGTTVWVKIFVGNALQPVWVPVGGSVTIIN